MAVRKACSDGSGNSQHSGHHFDGLSRRAMCRGNCLVRLSMTRTVIQLIYLSKLHSQRNSTDSTNTEWPTLWAEKLVSWWYAAPHVSSFWIKGPTIRSKLPKPSVDMRNIHLNSTISSAASSRERAASRIQSLVVCRSTLLIYNFAVYDDNASPVRHGIKLT